MPRAPREVGGVAKQKESVPGLTMKAFYTWRVQDPSYRKHISLSILFRNWTMRFMWICWRRTQGTVSLTNYTLSWGGSSTLRLALAKNMSSKKKHAKLPPRSMQPMQPMHYMPARNTCRSKGSHCWWWRKSKLMYFQPARAPNLRSSFMSKIPEICKNAETKRIQTDLMDQHRREADDYRIG